MKQFIPFSVFFFLALSNISCDDSKSNKQVFNSQNANNFNHNNTDCVNGSRQCFGNLLQVCQNKQWATDKVCGTGAYEELPACDPSSLDCRECVAGGTACGTDNHVHVCTADATLGPVHTQCDSALGEQCAQSGGNAACDSPCIRAAATKSYRGCEYWGVSTANNRLRDAFMQNFAFAIDNSNSAPVRVRITGSGASVDEMIPANTLQVITVDFNEEIRRMRSSNEHNLESGIFHASTGSGGFHLQTSLPVTVYQFSPYDFVIGSTYSYTNDASLMLPVSVLSKHYMVMSRPTFVLRTDYLLNSPGFVAVVATEDNTQVSLFSRSHTSPGDGITTLAPGGSGEYTLNRGDVLQVISRSDLNTNSCPTGEGSGKTSDWQGTYCNPGNDYDLTGSTVTASAPVAVFSGHNCTFIPFDSWACDHLEQMMFPLETWGKHFYVGMTHPSENNSSETNVIRVLAGEDNVTVSFTPETVSAPRTLGRGEYFEIMPPPDTHFEINSTGPILVGKFLLGQNYAGTEAGDPAFGLVVPVEQYRAEYTFATPPSMTVNFVSVIARIPTDNMDLITLNGTGLTASQYIPIGSTGWGVARIDLSDSGTGGSHTISAPGPTTRFGIEVYGYARYTSYLYPGGLDLEYINPIGK